VLSGAVPERARVGARQDHRFVDAVRLPPCAGRPHGGARRAPGGVLPGARLPVGLVQAAARAGRISAGRGRSSGGHAARERAGRPSRSTAACITAAQAGVL